MLVNKMLKWIAVGGIFVIPFVPVIIAPHSFFPFITGKNFAFRTLVEIIFASWFILASRDARYRPKHSGIYTAVGIFVLVVGVADLLGVNVSQSIWSNFERMEGYLTIVHLFLYFLVAGSVLNTMKLWDRFFYTSIGVSIFLCLYGYIQLSGELTINQGGVRLDSTFGNATYFGLYLLFHIFFLLMLFLRRTKDFSRDILISFFVGFGWFFLFLMHIGISPNFNVGKRMYLVGGVAVLVLFAALTLWKRRNIMEKRILQYGLPCMVFLIQFFGLYYTATRGAILGFVGGLLLTALLIALFERKRKLLRRSAVAGVFLVFLGVGIFLAAKDTAFVKSSPVLSRFTNLSFKEVGSRPLVWNMAIQGVKERPILGWGQNNFDIVFNKYYDPRMYSQEPWFDRAHNIVFDWLINAGIVGLISYLSLFGTGLYLIWKDPNGRFSLADKALLSGLLAGYFGNNLLVFDNITSYIPFFSVLAYIYYMTGVGRHSRLWSFMCDKKEVVNYVTAPLVAVVFAGALYLINIEPFLASRTLIDAMVTTNGEKPEHNLAQYKKVFAYNTIGKVEAREQLLNSTLQVLGGDTSQEQRQAFFELVKSEYDAQIKEMPLSTRHYYFIGAFLRVTPNVQYSFPYLIRAEELSPKKQNILMEIGTAYAELGDKDNALAYYKKAFELEKKFDQARIVYAVTAQLQKKEDVVKEVLEERFDTIEVADVGLMSAYLETGRIDIIVRIWERLVRVNPNIPQVRVSLAAAYFENHQLDKAIETLKELVTMHPDLKEQGEHLIREIRAGRRPDDFGEGRLKDLKNIASTGLSAQ